jgi:hypothetical protein
VEETSMTLIWLGALLVFVGAPDGVSANLARPNEWYKAASLRA